MNTAAAPTLWKYSLREACRRPGRSVLTLLGIVIGVAALVAIQITTDTTRRVHREMFEAVAGRAALEVVAEGHGGLDACWVETLRDVPGVGTTVPVVQHPAALLTERGAIPVLALGIDPARDAAARDVVVRSGKGLGSGDEIMIETGFASTHGITLGQEVRLLSATGAPTVRVVGLLDGSGPALFNGGSLVLLPLPTAQRLFALGSRITGVQLVLGDGVDAAGVEVAVANRLPPGLYVQAPAARSTFARETLAGAEIGFPVLSASSLVAGAFVILNTFHMSLGERRRLLALLRALGATRGQVARLLLREALILGIGGTVLGIGAGLVLAEGLRRVMEQLTTLTFPPLHLSLAPLVTALLLGPGIALAATYLPIRRATRRALLEDLLARRGSQQEDLRRWPAYLGLGLIVLLGGVVTGLVRGWIAPAVGLFLLAPLMALAMVGVVLSLPLLTPSLTRFAAVVLKPLFGAEAGLAVRQLQRYPGRTALTGGVLTIAVLFGLGFGQSLLNNVRHIHYWISTVAQGDYFIRPVWPDPTMLLAAVPMPETLADELAQVDGVARVDKFSWIPARANGRPVIVLAQTFAPDGAPPLALAEGDPDTVRRGLLAGDVVAGTVLARQLGLHVGDEITLETRSGPRAFRIAGTTAEYTVGGMTLNLEWAAARRYFEPAGAQIFILRARPGAAAALQPRLAAWSAQHGYLLQSLGEIKDTLDRNMSGFLGMTWLLMALVFVIASLGVVNTLTMNVLEQTRELGLLRAIGMRRRQVGKLVLGQALGLAFVSLLPGVLAGLALAYLMNLCTYPLTGNYVPFHLDAWLVLGGSATATAAAAGAALFPARRAATLSVIGALQYE